MLTDDEIDEFYENLEERKSIIRSFLETSSESLEEVILGWEKENDYGEDA